MIFVQLITCHGVTIDCNSGVNYTFHNDAMNRYSMIDYFICSPELVLPKHHVIILNDGDNLSDHLAIIRKIGYAEATAHNYCTVFQRAKQIIVMCCSGKKLT